MKIFFDTEFVEDGRTIDLLSIGMVREDGAEYYAETVDAWCAKKFGTRWNSQLDPWLLENVVPHLEGKGDKHKATIAREIVEFAGESPEFWAYYADYDWAALCQLYGRMIDLPKGWPMYCRDFKQVVDEKGLVLPEHDPDEYGPAHNALSDARWLADVFGTQPIVCTCLSGASGACGNGFCRPDCPVCSHE